MILNFIISVIISSESLINFAVTDMYKRLPPPQQNGKWKVTALNTPPEVSISDANYKLELELPKDITYKGTNFSWIKIQNEDFFKKVPINLKIRLWVPVAAAAKRLDKHKVLTKDDLQTKFSEEAGIEDIEDIIGMRTKRFIAKDEFVTKDMIEPLPLVEKGDRVEIVFYKNDVAIRSYGISKSDGWLNDSIFIDINGKIIKSQVIDKKTVRGEL
ncbi:MAG: flagellar basal body P-ring formation chaperone FlgA [bacterium]|nr:flagellar basal body P-ring formation chaperone FlgA [bacterium]